MKEKDPSEIKAESSLVPSDHINDADVVRPEKIHRFDEAERIPRRKFYFKVMGNPSSVTIQWWKPLLGCALFFLLMMAVFISVIVWIVKLLYSWIF